MDARGVKNYPGPSVTYRIPSPAVGCGVLSPEAVIAAQELHDVKKGLLALYSSVHGGIILDSRYMVVPFDDHMVHRGHAVFDTATLINGRLYRLDAHLERFYASMRKAQINSPFENHEQVKEIIARTCAATRKKDGLVRFWLSAGGNDFKIHPGDCIPTFWVAVFDASMLVHGTLTGIPEVTISSSHIPMKPGLLASAKTTNYMLNAMCSVEAVRRGGNLGIWIDEFGLAEASTAAVVVVSRQNVLLVPPFDKILGSITLLRVIEIAVERLGHGPLHPSLAHITSFEQRNISYFELVDAQEILAINGDFIVQPIISLDNKQLGSGVVGPFAKWLSAELKNEGSFGDRCIDNVPYELYGGLSSPPASTPVLHSRL